MIYKIRNYLPINALRVIYYSFVYSQLQYCIISYGTASDSVLHPLNIMHNKVLRALTFSHYRCKITPLYKQLGLKKIKDLHQLELSKHQILAWHFHPVAP